MLKRKTVFGAALVLAAVVFASCDLNVSLKGAGTQQSPADSGIDYTNYQTDYSIIVHNESSKNVVCFKGAPREANLISGAKAGSKTKLKKIDGFSESSDFVLWAITEEDYLAAKKSGDYTALDNKPFCRIYAYYNSEADANANLTYTISSKLGGQYFFNLQNTTRYNCEIRKDGLYGEPFMYAGAQTLNTKIYAMDGDYNFYPVFRKYDKNANAIVTSFPKTKKGNPQRINISLNSNEQAATIDCNDYFQDDFKMTASAAYLKINNQSKTGVKLMKGANAIPETTDTGVQTINSGKNATFTIKMDQTSSGESGVAFEEQVTIAGWKVGPDGSTIEIPANVFQAGYRYVLNITGPSYDDLKCEFEVRTEDAKDGSYKKGDLVKYEVNLD